MSRTVVGIGAGCRPWRALYRQSADRGRAATVAGNTPASITTGSESPMAVSSDVTVPCQLAIRGDRTAAAGVGGQRGDVGHPAGQPRAQHAPLDLRRAKALSR